MLAPRFLLSLRSIVPVAALSLTAACIHEVDGPDGLNAQSKEGSTKTEAEQWSNSDAPTLFSADLNFKLAELPQAGAAQNIPWASSYWPTYEDSINHKWDGASSEASSTKYGRAFSVT